MAALRVLGRTRALYGADQSPLRAGCQGPNLGWPASPDGGRWVNAGSKAGHEPQVTSLGHEEAGGGVVVCVLAAGGLKRELGARQ